MSRYYRMDIEVSEYDSKREKEIQAAAESEWSFDGDWYAKHRNASEAFRYFRESDSFGSLPFMSVSGNDNLCGGETEEEFTERLSKAIWKANGAFCTVTVNATYLSGAPFETHQLDESVYDELMRRENAAPLV